MENRLEARSYGEPAADADSDGTLGSAHATSGTPSRPVLAIPRTVTPANPSAARTPPKCARKDRGVNWNAEEVSALIQAKRRIFLEEIDVHDGRDLMNPDATKWVCISIEVSLAAVSPCLRDGPCCKTKWNQLISDYKKIADFFARTGNTEHVYWELTASNRKSKGLPRSFSEEVFYEIYEWFGRRPTMNPPHTRDLLSSEDGNFEVPVNESDPKHKEGGSEPESEDPMDFATAATQQANDSSDQSAYPNIGGRLSLPSLGGLQPRNNSPTASPIPRPRNCLPPGVTPVLISSSNTSHSQLRRNSGNTGVHRKTVSGHGLIAEATRASGAVMASQMKDMADASRNLEQSKMEVQQRLFSEQMQYQMEKD